MKPQFTTKAHYLTLLLVWMLLLGGQMWSPTPVSAGLEQGALARDENQSVPATIAEKFNLHASEHYIVFNAGGFAPNTITVKVGDTVTWQNFTDTSYTLRSGVPVPANDINVTPPVTPVPTATMTLPPTDTPSPTVIPTVTEVPIATPTEIPTATSTGTGASVNIPTATPSMTPIIVPTVRSSPNPQSTISIFLPIITDSSGSKLSAKSSAASSVIAEAADDGDFEQTLAPGDDFSYTFTTAGSFPYYLTDTNFFRGRVIVEDTDTTLASSSPRDGEDGVAVTRETIFEFDAPIDGDSVTAANFSASFGGATLETRLKHSPDGKRVTLFYQEPLPASARVQVTVNGDNITDTNGEKIDADGDGEPGGKVQIAFDTLSLTVIPGTSVCGRVFASELVEVQASSVSVNEPLGGVTITVDGQEDTLRTTTDETGNFCLDPAPAGRFFVHIDGRTATNGVAAGTYYPFVGKAWESIIGQQINVGDVYLPLVPEGTLQAVSESENTEIGFAPSVLAENPEFAEVKLMVPADSLYRDDGTRGGMVGIAPVAPDRLPGTLPEYLNFPIVITVQTDGATNFDEPAPVCFPNLPDPESGETLEAGEKSALFSFNHDTGKWGIMGSMTVTSDGQLVCTDPDVGIEAPGWHGSQPGSPPGPPPPPPPPCGGFSFSCGVGILFGGIDCGLSFIPGATCATSLALNTLSTIRDCHSGGAACGFSAAYNATSTAASCATSFSPGIGTAITCTGAIHGAAKSCGCVSRSALVYASQSEEPSELELQLALMEAYKNFYDVLFGSSVWTELDLTEGDPRIPQQEVSFLLEQTIAAIHIESDGGTNITTEEKSNLLELPRPASITDTDINELIEYINLSVELWQSGTSTHEEAGRTDFMDRSIFSNAIDEVEAALNAIEARGISSFNYQVTIAEAREQIIQNLKDPNQGEYPPEEIHYLLVDETNNFEQRNRLSTDGSLGIPTLRPNALYKISYIHYPTSAYGTVSFVAESAGIETEIPPTLLYPVNDEIDTDNDALIDLFEDVIGTDPTKPDSDDDGLFDGAEIQNGTNPLDGFIAQTGIIGTADTPGTAVDVCVENDLAIVADSGSGVSIFNVFDNMNPSIIAQVDTPGNALAVACGSGWVAVADGDSGLAVIDVSDPPTAELTQQVDVGGIVQAVAAAGNKIYVGMTNGQVAIVDPDTGTIQTTMEVGKAIEAIFINGDELFLLDSTSLVILSVSSDVMTEVSRIKVSGRAAPLEFGRKLFVGDDTAYVGYFTGYSTIDISDPNNPQIIGSPDGTQAAIHDLVTTSNGLLLGTTSFAGVSTLAVSLYNSSDPTDVSQFLTSFGTAEDNRDPRTLELYNGQAYVADQAGLQVINYLAADTQGITPTITIATNFAPGVAEESALLSVSANTNDDVQVRNVEFDIDGVQQFSDGSFPFEYRFMTPRIADQSTFSLTVRAFDTGGNATEVSQLITLKSDATPPRIMAVAPRGNSFGRADVLKTITATFNEPPDETTLTEEAFQLFTYGADGIPETSDDRLVDGGTVSYDADKLTASLQFDSALSVGHYRAVLKSTITDLAGNPLSTEVRWTFEAVPFINIGDTIPGETHSVDEIYTYWFAAEAGQEIFFDIDSKTIFNWKVVHENGTFICTDCSHSTALVLELGGIYILTIGSNIYDGTGPYELRLWDVPAPDQFNINIGDTISNGNPGAGAGNIESPGVRDVYIFNAEAGQKVFFHVHKLEDDSGVSEHADWQLVDENNSDILDMFSSLNYRHGVHVLELGGTYTMTVGSYSRWTGTYEAQISDVPAPDEFNIDIGDTISDGNPGAGAGNIETPGVTDIYTFNAEAGQRVFFDLLQGSNGSTRGRAIWKVVGENDTRIFSSSLGSDDPGTYVLESGGTYTMTVGDDFSEWTGTYEIRLWDVPAPDEFNINIGDTISDGNPGVGAGNIEIPGATDVYTFNAEAGQELSIAISTSDTGGGWQLEIFDENDTLISNSCCSGTSRFNVPDSGGTYTLIPVRYPYPSDWTGTYQLQITDKSP